MSTTTVTTQAELDAALTAHRDDPDAEIYIDSPAGVWLDITDTGQAYVEACGSASVRAWGSASVRAWDSASVRASDSASVRASDSASVSACGSASVSACGSASVRASGSASVRASDSACVRAWGSASVRAWGSASVRASKYVSVHLHSTRVTLDGGVVIDMTGIDETDPVQWAELHAEVIDGEAVLYKAVREDLQSAHGFAYPIGETVACEDWGDIRACGRGLHFSPQPWQAAEYDSQAVRFLEVRVAVAELRPLNPDKCKAPGCRVVREVNVHGAPVEPAAVTA